MRFEQTIEDDQDWHAEVCADLPDDLVELAEQLAIDAAYLGRRYPAESPGLWWDRASEAETLAVAEVRPAEGAAPVRAKTAWYRQPAAATAAVVLLMLACGWLMWGQDEIGRPAKRGPGPAVPFAPALAGGNPVLTLPGRPALGDATPASWTPEAYPDVSGEEEQVLHDELKRIRSAEL